MIEEKLKHLEFIQGVITRMANNSFLLKSWSVVLVSALFVVSAKDAENSYSLLALLPIVVFWSLDGYYLWMERLFRKLYNDVAQKESKDIDFSMDISVYKGNLRKQFNTWVDSLTSETVAPFHFVLLVATLIVACLENN